MLLILLILFTISYQLQAQHLAVEGDAVIVGKLKLTNEAEDSSLYIGQDADPVTQSTKNNTFVGHSSGMPTSFFPFVSNGIFASDNTFLGSGAGFRNNFGYKNTYIGRKAGPKRDSVHHSIAIGYNAKVRCNQCAVIGGTDDDAVQVGIGTEVPRHLLHLVKSDLNIRMGDASCGSGLGSIGFGNSLDCTNYALRGNENQTSLNSPPGGALNLKIGDQNILTAIPNRNVGLGTTNPDRELVLFRQNTGPVLKIASNVDGGRELTLGVNQSNGGWLRTVSDHDLSFWTNDKKRMTVRNSGEVVLNTLGTAGMTNLCLNANAEISPCSSSRRYKQNIYDLHTSSNLLHQFRPVSYQWIQDGSTDIGLVAEEVAKIDERLVTRNATGQIEGVKYDRIAVLLIDVVKKQEARIADLEKELFLRKEKLVRP